MNSVYRDSCPAVVEVGLYPVELTAGNAILLFSHTVACLVLHTCLSVCFLFLYVITYSCKSARLSNVKGCLLNRIWQHGTVHVFPEGHLIYVLVEINRHGM